MFRRATEQETASDLNPHQHTSQQGCEKIRDIALSVRKRNLTYLGKDKLNGILSSINSLKRNKVPGNFLEFGVALGGSGICIASELDDDRRFLGFDVFAMIPPPSEKDGAIPKERYERIRSGESQGIRGEKYYGYVENLHDVVAKNFSEFGLHVDGQKIQLVQGLYEETLPLQPEMTIAFAHIDCDWYEPVMLCLEYVAPRLSPGGIIILDDYNDWPGCKQAADEFCKNHLELDVKRRIPHCILQKRDGSTIGSISPLYQLHDRLHTVRLVGRLLRRGFAALPSKLKSR